MHPSGFVPRRSHLTTWPRRILLLAHFVGLGPVVSLTVIIIVVIIYVIIITIVVIIYVIIITIEILINTIITMARYDSFRSLPWEGGSKRASGESKV